jgi:hypothetical protein
MQCDSYVILSRHCTLRYDAGCRDTHLYRLCSEGYLLSGCSVVTASNDGAQFLRDPFFKMTQSSLLLYTLRFSS